MRKMKFLILCLTVLFSNSFAVQTIYQDNQDATHVAFQQDISAKAFDIYNGTFYLATNADNGDYSIASATRDDSYFDGLSTNVSAQGKINYIALINTAGEATDYVAFDNNGTNELRFVKLADKSVPSGMTKARTDFNGSGICDVAGAAALDGSLLMTGGYNKTNQTSYIFLRVHASGGENKENSGILVFSADPGSDTTTRVGVGNDNLAARADNQTDNDNFCRDGALDPLDLPVVNDLYWDSNLETLFIAASVTTANSAGAKVSAILKLKVTQEPKLVISAVLPINVNAAVDDETTIFAGYFDHLGIIDSRILKIRTMRTTTDKNYLIVNGGIGADNNVVGNQFYALRYNPTSGEVVQNDTNGTALGDGFVRNGGATPLDGGNAGSLVIGGGLAPWLPDVSDPDMPITDMQVIGDTVYVSVSGNDRDVDNDPGIWASRAMFDDNDVIIGWTKWERVFPSVNNNNSDKTKFFAVDGVNGKIWQVSQDSSNNFRIVKRMAWKTVDFTANSLPSRLSTDLSDGCFCVLDLPKGIPGLESAAANSESLVLFGGYEKVVFARTKANNNAVTTNFSVASDYLGSGSATTLPSGAGCVRCLSFSRNAEDEDGRGYFFAGTEYGLYVFSSDANDGFNGANGLSDLNITPFNDFTWKRMAENIITGFVTRIECNGKYLFVVEQDVKNCGKIITKLHRFMIDNDVTTMETSRKVIAESGVNDIPDNTIFTGFELISNVFADPDEQYGILSTNLGSFVSDDFVNVFDPLVDSWVVVDNSMAYNFLSSTKRVPLVKAVGNDGFNSIAIGIALADANNKNYFQQSLFQLFGVDIGSVGITDYTNATVENGGAGKTYLDRSLYLWTDGGRRFYSRFNAGEASSYATLHSFPFYSAQWNMNDPLAPEDLATVPRIYWIENISGLGVILAGTDTGVITLE